MDRLWFRIRTEIGSYTNIFLHPLLNIRTLSSPNTHTHTHPFNGPFSGTARVSRYQKGKTNLDFTEARVSECCSGISWAICKSAPCSRQITTPAPHHSVFTGRMPFLPPHQQRQSIGGILSSAEQLKSGITDQQTKSRAVH